MRHDVGGPEDRAEAAALARNEFGRLDVLVDSADICVPIPIMEQSLAGFERQPRVNQPGSEFG